MRHQRSEKGLYGEERAAQYLVELGYEVLAHDWKHPEIRIQVDLVVRRAGRAYIVEVKNHKWLGTGFERLLSWKQRDRLLSLARRLNDKRFGSLKWGFLWVWVERGNKCQILESHDL